MDELLCMSVSSQMVGRELSDSTGWFAWPRNLQVLEWFHRAQILASSAHRALTLWSSSSPDNTRSHNGCSLSPLLSFQSSVSVPVSLLLDLSRSTYQRGKSIHLVTHLLVSLLWPIKIICLCEKSTRILWIQCRSTVRSIFWIVVTICIKMFVHVHDVYLWTEFICRRALWLK